MPMEPMTPSRPPTRRRQLIDEMPDIATMALLSLAWATLLVLLELDMAATPGTPRLWHFLPFWGAVVWTVCGLVAAVAACWAILTRHQTIAARTMLVTALLLTPNGIITPFDGRPAAVLAGAVYITLSMQLTWSARTRLRLGRAPITDLPIGR